MQLTVQMQYDDEVEQVVTMDDVPLDGKPVLVRVDFNVAVGDDGVVDQFEDYRIEAALPTIQELLARRCKVLLLTHLGRPGKGAGDFDLAPIRVRLAELLREEVRELKQLHGDSVTAVISGLDPSSVAMFPNVRLDEREVAGSVTFAKELVGMAEAYVNEAFSVSHRDHTSIALVPKLLPSCAGRRTAHEVAVLSNLATSPIHPYVAVVSGAKVKTKVGLLEKLLGQVDRLCLGGAVANAFLAALDKCPRLGCEKDDVDMAKKILDRAADKIELPKDVVVGSEQGAEAQIVRVGEIPDDVHGVWDVGPETVKGYLNACEGAASVIWNGPLGKYEREAYREGTHAFARGLSVMPAFRVVGGGDTVTALERLRLTDSFDHVSVGGGAMVSLIEGVPMPGLLPLLIRDGQD